MLQQQNIVYMLYNGYFKEVVGCYLLFLFLAFKQMKTVCWFQYSSTLLEVLDNKLQVMLCLELFIKATFYAIHYLLDFVFKFYDKLFAMLLMFLEHMMLMSFLVLSLYRKNQFLILQCRFYGKYFFYLYGSFPLILKSKQNRSAFKVYPAN